MTKEILKMKRRQEREKERVKEQELGEQALKTVTSQRPQHTEANIQLTFNISHCISLYV